MCDPEIPLLGTLNGNIYIDGPQFTYRNNVHYNTVHSTPSPETTHTVAWMTG